MPTIPEDRLASWTKPAFGNEEDRAEYTEAAIRDAVREHDFLRTLPLNVFSKGSYKNNTNVRRDSDVDVAVEYRGIMYPTYGDDVDSEAVDRAHGLEPYSGPLLTSSGSLDVARFKSALHDALAGAFGAAAVTRHNKVFTVRESTRSLASDVVPCATHRHYWGPGFGQWVEGIRLLPDRPSTPVENYPEQQYKNGVRKNNNTGRRYKRVVRILKNLENQLVSDHVISELPGYLIECLTYQAPVPCFNASTWAARVRNVLDHLWKATEHSTCEKELLEVNEVKYLFHRTQKWTRDEARTFVYEAWQYVADS
jgi:hypothetical protein